MKISKKHADHPFNYCRNCGEVFYKFINIENTNGAWFDKKSNPNNEDCIIGVCKKDKCSNYNLLQLLEE